MGMTSIECEATTCIYHNGGRGCDADFITVDACGQCLGYEEKKENQE